MENQRLNQLPENTLDIANHGSKRYSSIYLKLAGLISFCFGIWLAYQLLPFGERVVDKVENYIDPAPRYSRTIDFHSGTVTILDNLEKIRYDYPIIGTDYNCSVSDQKQYYYLDAEDARVYVTQCVNDIPKKVVFEEF